MTLLVSLSLFFTASFSTVCSTFLLTSAASRPFPPPSAASAAACPSGSEPSDAVASTAGFFGAFVFFGDRERAPTFFWVLVVRTKKPF